MHMEITACDTLMQTMRWRQNNKNAWTEYKKRCLNIKICIRILQKMDKVDWKNLQPSTSTKNNYKKRGKASNGIFLMTF